MFHVIRDNKRFGPYSAEQLKKLIATDKLHDFDLVMRVGETESQLLSELTELHGVDVPSVPCDMSSASQSSGTHVGGKSHGASAQPLPGLSSLGGQILSGGKVAAAVGTVAGFIGDFLEPLAPINGFLFLATMAACVILCLLWIKLPRDERFRFDHWFPQQSLIFSSFLLVAFGGWFLLQQLHADHERGVLGGNVPIVAQAQDAFLQLKQDVAAIKEDVGEVKDTTNEIQRGTQAIVDTTSTIQQDTTAIRADTAGIHNDTSAIREGVAAIGKQRGLVAAPTTAADHYHNAMVHMRDGNHSASEESFLQFFRLSQAEVYEPYEQYAKLVLGKYAPERARRMLSTLAEQQPASLSARLVSILETTGGEAEARDRIFELVKEHAEYLPAYIALYDLIPPGLLYDDMTRSQIQVLFESAGGAEGLKTYILNPAEGVGATLLERGVGFGRKTPIDPMDRLLVGMRADPNITLLWLGVDDARPGRELLLAFAEDTVVRLPLDSPDNPAAYADPDTVPRTRARGSCVAVEIPRFNAGRQADRPTFIPRGNDDIRIFPHAGELDGVAIDEALDVQVSYVDANGRKVSFPKPIKLFSEATGEAGGMFAAEVERRDTFDPTPVLQITPAVSMSRVEVSGRADGPFVMASQHMNVTTMNEIPCGTVPFLAASRGSTTLWVRGKTDAGKDISPVSLEVRVPPAVRWKTYEPAAKAAGAAQAIAPKELEFEPPDTFSDFYIDRIVFSPDGTRIAAMMERAGIVVWDVRSARQIQLFKAETAKTLAFSDDGSRVTNGLDIFAMDTAKKTSCVMKDSDTFGAAVSASFAVAATVDRSQRLAIYDYPVGTESASAELGQEHGFPQVVAISPDATLIAVGGPHVDVVWVVDSRSGSVRKQFGVPPTGVTGVAFSPDGTQLLAAGSKSCVRLWNLSTGQDTAPRHTLDDLSPQVMWTGRGVPVVADIGPAALSLTNARTGESIAQIEGPLKKFAISPAGDAIGIALKTSVIVRPLD
jgi:hypothetical protein